MSRLRNIDLTATLSKEESVLRIATAQRRLSQLRLFSAGLLENHVVGPGLLVLVEGFDAAGKGGAIRRLTAGLDPRHVSVCPIGPPSTEELRHHFLWRFQQNIPGEGEMTVFDRSWYGRLLVERVEGGIDDKTAIRSAHEIVEFEKMLVRDRVTIVKFWLHLSEDEQLRRFHERANDPLKHWKLTPEDWHNRERRHDYERAVKFMVKATDHDDAHWDLISADNKHFARAAVLETLITRWERDLKRHGFKVP
ncbi:MAG: polyphosphate kinase 2 family protein [Acidimicrobiales bacterium]